MHKIMITEDDSTIASLIENQLKAWEYNVHVTRDFNDVMAEFAEFAPELVLLDISLPFYNGYYWCSQIRRISKVPIIFISSNSDNMNMVMAMNMGADDFITKPFDINVLIAKIQAIIRRTYEFSGQTVTNVLEYKGMVLNLSDATLIYAGESIELTKNEFRIMESLMKNNCRVVSRDELMERLWATDSFVDENTLTVNVTRLRKKMENIGAKDFIHTKKGMGYIIE